MVDAHADRTAADVDALSRVGNQLSSDALRMRLVCMFTGEGERPQASGESGGVPQATNGLILDALEAARSFWKARKNEIRSCCAPAKIDQEEIRGYLLADVLGQPVLTPKDARAVGKRAYTQATAATKRLEEQAKTAKEALRAAARAGREELDGARLAAAASAAQAEILAEAYDLKVPQQTVGAKRKAQPAQSVPAARVRRSECAAIRADGEVLRRRHEVEALGPRPELPDVDAPLHAWRRFDIKEATHSQAEAALDHASRMRSVKFTDALEKQLSQDDEEEYEREEREIHERREREREEDREFGSKWDIHCEFTAAYANTVRWRKDQDEAYQNGCLGEPGKDYSSRKWTDGTIGYYRNAGLVATWNGPAEDWVEGFNFGWQMVAGDGIGRLPRLRKPVPPVPPAFLGSLVRGLCAMG